MQYTLPTEEKKIVAIIICNPVDPLSGKTALKYSYVDNRNDSDIQKFMKFVAGFPTAKHVNFYSRTDQRFLGRLYVER